MVYSDPLIDYTSYHWYSRSGGSLYRFGLQPEYITPYSPEQNGAIERFMRTLKEECIWLNAFASFREAKSKIETWIEEYNTERPHQELGYSTPTEYREKLAA